VSRVDLKVNGTVVASDSSAPYSFTWDSTGVANGMNNLVAVAYDAAGNAGVSATVAVNVANTTAPLVADTVAPALAIDNPVAGAVSGTVAVSLSATDNSAASGISQTLKIDATVVATGNGSALAYSWNTRKYAKGVHTVTATARDAAGNTTTKTVTVTVQ
jgi:thermitase